MTKNNLKLNDSKTEFFIASPPHLMHRLTGTTLCIGTTEISTSATIRNFGVVFDSAMTMSPHITSLCKSLNFFLWNISRIRRFIDQETCNTTMRALVLSKLDYANALLLGCKKADILRLQRLQNKAARIIFQVPKMHSSSELLSTHTRLALFYSLIIHCIFFVYSSLLRPLSKITVARDRYLTKDFNNVASCR